MRSGSTFSATRKKPLSNKVKLYASRHAREDLQESCIPSPECQQGPAFLIEMSARANRYDRTVFLAEASFRTTCESRTVQALSPKRRQVHVCRHSGAEHVLYCRIRARFPASCVSCWSITTDLKYGFDSGRLRSGKGRSRMRSGSTFSATRKKQLSNKVKPYVTRHTREDLQESCVRTICR